jgi:hypothetical protein
MSREACLERILGGVSVAVMAAGLAVTLTAQAPTNNTIYACVNPSGLVRIIPPRVACLGSEQPVQWNITGPAGPQGPPGESDYVPGAHRVGLQAMTITGGNSGILLALGASIEGYELRVTGADWGVSVGDSQARLWHSVIENSTSRNVAVAANGHVTIWNSIVRNAGFAGIDVFGGFSAEGTLIMGNGSS